MYKYQIILSDTEEFYKHYLAEQVYFFPFPASLPYLSRERSQIVTLSPASIRSVPAEMSTRQLQPAMELRIPEACFLTSGIQTSPFSKRPLKKRRDGLDFKNPRDRMAFLIRGA